MPTLTLIERDYLCMRLHSIFLVSVYHSISSITKFCPVSVLHQGSNIAGQRTPRDAYFLDSLMIQTKVQVHAQRSLISIKPCDWVRAQCLFGRHRWDSVWGLSVSSIKEWFSHWLLWPHAVNRASIPVSCLCWCQSHQLCVYVCVCTCALWGVFRLPKQLAFWSLTHGCGEVRVITFRAHAVASVCAYIWGSPTAEGWMCYPLK